MVRLPGSAAEWEQHIHTSGRAFLSNPLSSETRWLWQKWDMKGRLFVRDISNPARQVWVDQMDLPMRLQSGTASTDEIARYIAHTPSPPPPPPPPPHQQQQQQQPPPSHYPPPFHQQPNQYHPPHHQQHHQQHHPHHQPYHHDINRNPKPHHRHPHHSDPRHSDLRHSDPHFPHHAPQPSNVSQVTNHHPLHPVPPARPPHSFHSAPYHQFPASRQHQRVDSQHHPPAPTPPHPYSPRPHSPDKSYNRDQKSNKRPHDPHANSHGRYWSNNDRKQSKKRSRTAPNSNSSPDLEFPSKASRFAPIQEPIRPRSPRPTPPSPKPTTLSGDVYGSFQPRSPAAQCILRSSHVRNVSTVGLLHDRDFKSTVADNSSSPNSVQITANGDEDEYSFEVVVGTSEELEKEYLRLTSAPRPEAVRPPRVLIKSLAHIKSRWRSGSQEYDWACRQLKSIRQDYKVQHIADRHVVDVYETHARIALENNDLGEFNTCVAQVQELYRTLDCPQQVQDEFASYRIIYNLLVRASQWEQAKILERFTAAERKRPATRFALQIRHAIVTGNYRQYFALCSNPPPKTMVSYLLLRLHDRVRYRAVAVMTATYGPGNPGVVPLRVILGQMGWVETNQPADLLELVHAEAVVPSDEEEIMGKLRALSRHRQPAWVFEALSFLAGANVALWSDPNSTDPLLDRVFVDFKTTKAQGLRERKANSKLITHAGTEEVKLMK